VTSHSKIDHITKLSNNRNLHYRRSSQGIEDVNVVPAGSFANSPKHNKTMSHRHPRKLTNNLRSDSSPAEKLAFLQELKKEQVRAMNKSNVKASLFDMIN